MVTVSFCVAVTEPDRAVTVTTAVLSVVAADPDKVAVPSPSSVNVRPFSFPDKVADRVTPDGTPAVVMVTECSVPGTKVAAADEVMASTCTVNAWVVFGPTPLFASTVKV